MKNQLEMIDLSSDDIEKQLKQYEFEFVDLKSRQVESMKFPYFVEAFYNWIFYEQQLPSFDEFVDYYFEVNRDKDSIEWLDSIQSEALKGRLSRTYPSLCRDIHFAKMADEILDLEIFYNIELDTEKGIDVLVGDKYGFHLFYDSKRSHEFRRNKDRNHDLDIIEFDLPFNERDGKEINNIYLYSEWHIIKALELIVKEGLDGSTDDCSVGR